MVSPLVVSMRFTDLFVDSMVSLIEWNAKDGWWMLELVPAVEDPPMLISIEMNERGYLTAQLTLKRPDFQGCIRDPTFSLLRTTTPKDTGAIRRGLLRYCPSHERELKTFVDLVKKHGLMQNAQAYAHLCTHPLFYGS